jgi:hypothetical protein
VDQQETTMLKPFTVQQQEEPLREAFFRTQHISPTYDLSLTGRQGQGEHIRYTLVRTYRDGQKAALGLLMGSAWGCECFAAFVPVYDVVRGQEGAYEKLDFDREFRVKDKGELQGLIRFLRIMDPEEAIAQLYEMREFEDEFLG